MGHPEFFPVEVNTADFYKLIRVPGIGRISAQKIISACKDGRITTLDALKKMGIIVQKARSFITVNNCSPKTAEPQKELIQKQLFLWDEI
jgi:predicted DNA-binding helix-hairpin-helix protein